ncbi:MAG: hypothetical protein DSY59_01540, partial [Persephonella sp.]
LFQKTDNFNKKIIINLGNFSKDRINKILSKANKISGKDEKEKWKRKINYISSQFLDVTYKRISLDFKTDKEILVIQLEGVDCMTFVEYVEALAKSKDFNDFIDKLRYVRYKKGIVDYKYRNHFFTDWIDNNGYRDIGKDIAPFKAIKVEKLINFSDKRGKVILPEVEVKNRTFYYIKVKDFDKEIINKLETGDLIGSYAYGDKNDWLDVTHIGIVIKKGNRIYFRNASSLKKYNKVVDIPIEDYLRRKNVKGLVILRKEKNFK